MEKIKLVIWDLDETFWKGTLSEEGIKLIPENLEIVKTLTDRGIINSIVSKNDFESAKNKLIEIGIWDYFVFPAIEWQPKGLLVKQVIENCQLRDTNVLFLDDNKHNLNEAKFYNPNLNIAEPDFIPEILEHNSFLGKDDREHSRLKQYKLLEEKAAAKTNFSNNQDFLEQSDIQLQKITSLESHLERITELLNRTNQLNFTKIRLEEKEISKLLRKEHLQHAAIQVRDKYGDYGIVGFYSFDPKSNKLLHFVFSCRILNLGIPQYIYAGLGFPEINTVPEIAEPLDLSKPHWIKETFFEIINNDKTQDASQAKILFIGGCDYDQLLFYLQHSDIAVKSHLNFNNRGGFMVRPSHSDILLAEKNYSNELRQKVLENKKLPFSDKAWFQSGLYEEDYDCFIYNPRMDFELQVYQHKKDKYKVPYGGIGKNWTDPKDWGRVIASYRERRVLTVDEAFLESFAQEFENLGHISPERFKENLTAIRNSIPAEKAMMLINCPELDLSFHPEGKMYFDRFREMNKAIDEFVGQNPNVFLLDVRKIIDHESKITTDLGHFQRKYYRDISIELLAILDRILSKKVPKELSLNSILRGYLMEGVYLAKALKRKIFN